MSIASAIVLFAVIWFMVLFVVLPLRLRTQGEEGKIVPGTHASAPAGPVMRQKLRVVTLASIVIWALIAGVILSGWITIQDFDVMHRLSDPAGETGE